MHLSSDTAYEFVDDCIDDNILLSSTNTTETLYNPTICPEDYSRAYNFQIKINESYIKKLTLINSRKIKNSGISKAPSIQDTLSLYALKCSVGLSHSSMDAVLGCFTSIMKNHNVEIPLYNSSNSLHNICSKDIIQEEMYPLKWSLLEF